MESTAYNKAAECWPQVSLRQEHFVTHLHRVFAQKDSVQPFDTWLEAANIRELWLACACYHKCPKAMEIFEAQYIAPLDVALKHLDKSGALTDDIKQRLRVKLFVDDESHKARILSYQGSGALHRWVRVAAVRLGLDLRSATKKYEQQDFGNEIDSVPQHVDGPELAHLRKHYGAELKEAFSEIVAGLEPEQLVVLRYHYTDNLTIQEIGKIFGVHKGTMSRRIEKIRVDIGAATRKRLRAKLRVNEQELGSIMRLVPSQLKLSLARLIAE